MRLEQIRPSAQRMVPHAGPVGGGPPAQPPPGAQKKPGLVADGMLPGRASISTPRNPPSRQALPLGQWKPLPQSTRPSYAIAGAVNGRRNSTSSEIIGAAPVRHRCAKPDLLGSSRGL